MFGGIVTRFTTILFAAALLGLNLLIVSAPAFAQDDQESVYDPFIDYSEFEEAGEEEADVNFFRNGRLLTAALAVGQRTFTQGMNEVLSDNVAYGLYFSYFFDLRYALQFSYVLGSHDINIVGPTQTATGTADISYFGLDMKYYFNMQNVTKGLSGFNPYLLFGLSSVNREAKFSGNVEFATQKATAFDLGAGFEVPVLRNEAYLGFQALYQLVSFDDENEELFANGEASGKYLNGDILTFTFLIGKNF